LITEYNKLINTNRKSGQNQQFAPSSETLEEKLTEQQEEHQGESLSHTAELVKNQEEATITLLLNHFDGIVSENLSVSSYILQELEEITFQVPVYNAMIKEMADRLSRKEAVGSLYFIKHPDASIRKESIRLLSSTHAVSSNWEKFSIIIPKDEDLLSTLTPRLVLRTKKVALKVMMEEIESKMKNESDGNAINDLMYQHMEFKKIAMTIDGLLGIVVG